MFVLFIFDMPWFCLHHLSISAIAQANSLILSGYFSASKLLQCLESSNFVIIVLFLFSGIVVFSMRRFRYKNAIGMNIIKKVFLNKITAVIITTVCCIQITFY